MKIFITGITGFAGGSLANYFSARGHHVQGIGRKVILPDHISRTCGYRQADICKPVDMIDADIVIHTAALASDTASFKDVYAVNVEGTQNVLKAAGNTPHFIYISSSSVYHFLNHPMKENEGGVDYHKLSGYGKSKFLGEKLVIEDKGINKKTILRPRAIYGKYDQVLLPRLLKMAKGNRLFLPQRLSGNISLTHISNLIYAVELCILKQAAALEVFNVADNEVYDLYPVLTTLIPLAAGRPLKIIKVNQRLFNIIVAVNNKIKLNPSLNPFAALSLTGTAVLNIDRIIQQTGYDPVKNFDNSYTDIIDWIHKEGGWKLFFKPGYN